MLEKEEERTIGKVIRFFEDKNFGFIKSDDFELDIFIHGSQIENDGKLVEGDNVEFFVDTDSQGRLVARNLKKIVSMELA